MIKKLLTKLLTLSVLFKAHKEEFLRIFEEQKEEIEILRLKRKSDVNKEIIKLYGIEFVIEKNN